LVTGGQAFLVRPHRELNDVRDLMKECSGRVAGGRLLVRRSDKADQFLMARPDSSSALDADRPRRPDDGRSARRRRLVVVTRQVNELFAN
jgi:hypothetical protein